jgi:hypothetical protein
MRCICSNHLHRPERPTPEKEQHRVRTTEKPFLSLAEIDELRPGTKLVLAGKSSNGYQDTSAMVVRVIDRDSVLVETFSGNEITVEVNRILKLLCGSPSRTAIGADTVSTVWGGTSEAKTRH